MSDPHQGRGCASRPDDRIRLIPRCDVRHQSGSRSGLTSSRAPVVCSGPRRGGPVVAVGAQRCRCPVAVARLRRHHPRVRSTRRSLRGRPPRDRHRRGGRHGYRRARRWDRDLRRQGGRPALPYDRSRRRRLEHVLVAHQRARPQERPRRAWAAGRDHRMGTRRPAGPASAPRRAAERRLRRSDGVPRALIGHRLDPSRPARNVCVRGVGRIGRG